MAVAPFDTLKFANTLKAAGVPGQQAEAQAAAFAEALAVNFRELATKDDLAQLGKDIRRDMADLRDELKRDVGDFRDEFKRDVGDLRVDLRREIKDEGFKLQTQITKLQGEMALLKWMMGLVLTGVVGILIRVLFVRIP